MDCKNCGKKDTDKCPKVNSWATEWYFGSDGKFNGCAEWVKEDPLEIFREIDEA